MGIETYSTNPALNTSVAGIDIGEGCDARNLNDAMRQLMSDMRRFYDTYVNIPLPLAIASGGTGSASATAALVALGGLGVAYQHLPQFPQTGAFSFALTQDGGHIYYTGAAAAATLPANATAAFPIGTVIAVVNDGSGALTLTRAGGVSMKWAQSGANADRTLAIGGVASLIKVGTDSWFVSGAGLT
jgi:hypothetical protein